VGDEVTSYERYIPAWLLHSTSFYAVLISGNDQLLFANDYFNSIFTKNIDEQKVTKFTDFIEQTDLETVTEFKQKCLNEEIKTPQSMVLGIFDSRSNRYSTVKWECSFLGELGKHKAGFLLVGHDIIAIENKEVAEAHYDETIHHIFDDIQIGVLVQKPDSSVVLSNRKAEELLGLTKDQLYGKTIYDEDWKIVTPDQEPFPVDMLPTYRAIINGESVYDVIMGVHNPKADQQVWLQVDSMPDLTEHGDVIRVVTTFIDISKRIETERKAEQQQLQLRTMMDNAPMVIFMKSVDGKYMFFNKMYKDFIDLDLKPGMTDFDIFEEDFANWCKVKDEEVCTNDKVISFEHVVGDEIFFETKFPIKNEQGDIYAIGGFSQNITKQKKEEEVLRLQESVITNAKDSIVITKPKSPNSFEQVITFVNQAFCDMTGYSREEIIGKSPDILYGKNSDKDTLENLSKAIREFRIFETEIVNYKKDGDDYWVNFNIVPVLNELGELTHWISIQQEITERKKYEHKLEEALKEKTTLLSEIHHRVKNNLAIVSGLLELQSMEVDPEHKLPLQRSINRVHSIAMVHELMYQTEKLSSVNIKEYLDQLIPAIQRTIQTVNDVKINIDLENYLLNINQAIPLGLLMNELLTNSFKYAFLNRLDGKIDIIMNLKEDALEFIYRDNGPGFPKGKDFTSSNSLGLSLIQAQLGQLHASYEVVTDDRFELAFTFNISDKGPHANI
jgi:PAS domain S-box-containing protein